LSDFEKGDSIVFSVSNYLAHLDKIRDRLEGDFEEGGPLDLDGSEHGAY
jgi:hypothetical protein